MDNRLYLSWVDKQLERLQGLNIYTDDSVCAANYYDCLELGNKIGSGGTAVILEARINPANCGELFPVPKKYPVAVKLCSADQLDQKSCRSVADEIKHMLKYSRLHAMCICTNFLLCFGYGINCCLLVSLEELDTVPPDQFKNKALLGELGYNIDFYIQDTLSEGCDTFIITNLLSGPDLSNISAGFEFTARQTFEIVYSLLCSVIYLQGIPADRHLDNYMLNETTKGVVVSIGDTMLYFDTTVSFVHIDYQVLRKAQNVKFSDLGELHRFIPREYNMQLQSLLNNDDNLVRKVHNLASIFQKERVSSAPIGDNVELTFSVTE